jgi:hypothetical protein
MKIAYFHSRQVLFFSTKVSFAFFTSIIWNNFCYDSLLTICELDFWVIFELTAAFIESALSSSWLRLTVDSVYSPSFISKYDLKNVLECLYLQFILYPLLRPLDWQLLHLLLLNLKWWYALLYDLPMHLKGHRSLFFCCLQLF